MLRLASHALKRTRPLPSHITPLRPSLESLSSARRYNSTRSPEDKTGESHATNAEPTKPGLQEFAKKYKPAFVEELVESGIVENAAEAEAMADEELVQMMQDKAVADSLGKALDEVGTEWDGEYPNLMQRHPMLDNAETMVTRAGHSLTIRQFPEARELEEYEDEETGRSSKKGRKGEQPEIDESIEPPKIVSPFPTTERNANFHEYQMMIRITTKQTGKGKVNKWAVLFVVGDGNGLVGMGQAKDDDPQASQMKARNNAYRSLDYIDRFEGRTFWTEMKSKLGGTEIILRPRPVGFGLRCNPHIHQILKAAGIKDASAKVWGSRRPINVIKLLLRMIMPGNAPLAMGDGIGGGGSKMMKGSGMRSAEIVERERGRRLVPLRG